MGRGGKWVGGQVWKPHLEVSGEPSGKDGPLSYGQETQQDQNLKEEDHNQIQEGRRVRKRGKVKKNTTALEVRERAHSQRHRIQRAPLRHHESPWVGRKDSWKPGEVMYQGRREGTPAGHWRGKTGFRGRVLLGIFPTQGSNLGLLHYRQSLYHLSHQGSSTKVYCSFIQYTLVVYWGGSFWIIFIPMFSSPLIFSYAGLLCCNSIQWNF